MTLHGSRVYCDVPGCDESDWSVAEENAWMRGLGDIGPACRARHTDDQLREILARHEET